MTYIQEKKNYSFIWGPEVKPAHLNMNIYRKSIEPQVQGHWGKNALSRQLRETDKLGLPFKSKETPSQPTETALCRTIAWDLMKMAGELGEWLDL